MNGLTKTLIGLGVSFLVLKVVQQKPIRNYILGALLDGAYYVIKRKLKG